MKVQFDFGMCCLCLRSVHPCWRESRASHLTYKCARIGDDALRVEDVAQEGVLASEYNMAGRLLLHGRSESQELVKTVVAPDHGHFSAVPLYFSRCCAEVDAGGEMSSW